MKIWIGLAHIQPKAGNEVLGESSGAFVPAVGLGTDIDEFVEKLISKLDDYEFDVIEIEDIELYEERLKKFNIVAEVRSLVDKLTIENPIALSRVEAYDN